MRSLPLGGQQGINIYEQEQTLTLRSPLIYNGQVYILFCFLFFFFISIDSLASTYPGNANAPALPGRWQPGEQACHRQPVWRKFRNICLLSHNEALGQRGHWGRRRGRSKCATAGGAAKGGTRFPAGWGWVGGGGGQD